MIETDWPQQQDYVSRNREHQRQSRARRKDYVTNLEERLRRYESEGARHSIEIQAAARRVADENGRLRELLQAYGVANDTIEAHLKGSAIPNAIDDRALSTRIVFLDHDRSPPRHDHARVSLKESRSQVDSQRTGSSHGRQIQIDSSSYSPVRTVPLSGDLKRKRKRPTAQLPTRATYPHPTTPDGKIHLTGRDCQRRSVLANDGPQDLAEDELPATSSVTTDLAEACTSDQSKSADEMDCEDAARIIARMRGHENHESLRPELGCAADRTCMVKNMRILQMA